MCVCVYMSMSTHSQVVRLMPSQSLNQGFNSQKREHVLLSKTLHFTQSCRWASGIITDISAEGALHHTFQLTVCCVLILLAWRRQQGTIPVLIPSHGSQICSNLQWQGNVQAFTCCIDSVGEVSNAQVLPKSISLLNYTRPTNCSSVQTYIHKYEGKSNIICTSTITYLYYCYTSFCACTVVTESKFQPYCASFLSGFTV